MKIVLCDFTRGVRVEALNLKSRHRGGPGGTPPHGFRVPPGGPGGSGFPLPRPGNFYPNTFYPPPPPHFDTPHTSPPLPSASINPSSASFGLDESFHSGTYMVPLFPGETRIQLDLTRLMSSCNTSPPSRVEKSFGKKIHEHQLSRRSYSGRSGGRWSGIAWAMLIHLIVKRLSNRLEMVHYMLDATETGGMGVGSVYAPFDQTTSAVAASPPYQICSTWTTYTNYIVTTTILLYSRLTASEKLILGGVKEMTMEICWAVDGMWAEGFFGRTRYELREPPSTIADDNDDSDDKEDGTEIDVLLDLWSKL
ncbi:hypothetical protein GYMLUDRAFT_246480 [Collybiopsis luxurians FD-317 M1]|uniref:Uncharacterized protein n=1 Tax=Collybiopsis luxurians FD-317 M1 TaxID=944289 RepID=A0A0D0CII4_9AGAR|nr:hypothetical protein GYMLUDRAFT_246480 [Collybiopsis luxurians FD-317 M1]